MFTLSNSKSFVYTTLFILFGFIILYIVTYDTLVIKHPNEAAYSYKDFLLKHTQGSRIIIESGSNSYHGIDSLVLEKTFNKLTLNLSDNAGYPLEYKLKRIQTYAHTGDIVLLPLELSHYSYTNIPKNFFDNIFTILNSYYTSLNILDKLNLIATTPLSSFFTRLTHYSTTSFNQNKYLFEQASKFQYGERGDAQGGITKKDTSCGEKCTNLQFKASKKFIENIHLIKEIEKKKNIKFIFMPPTFIINSKYMKHCQKTFEKFNDSIVSFMLKYKIPYISTITDNIYSEKYMKDNCDHLIRQGRDLRTTLLIETIKNSPYLQYFENNTSIQYNLDFNLTKTIQNLQKKLTPIYKNRKIKLATDTKHILLIKGWYVKEAWGVWSQGNESQLTLKLPHSISSKDIQISFDSNHFGKVDKTTLFINNINLGAYHFSGITTIKVPKYIYQETDGILRITFKYKNVISPHDINHNNSDDRKLKLGLKSILIKNIN